MSVRIFALTCAAFFALTSAAQAGFCTAPHSIRRVRALAAPGADLVVFDVNGSPNRPFTVKTAHPPFLQDPSGLPVHVAGARFKEITFSNVAWMCTIRRHLPLPLRAVRDVEKLGQFEGIVAYVVGYRAGSAYLGTHSHRVGANWRVVMRFRR